ncbi:MAG: hypothetical protein J0L61_12235 [Planctomycetes bacterium]|nr:hypothetical protein [Planctomycetota bacterium]
MPETLLADLARAEETRLAKGFTEISDHWKPFAGGVMARADPGAWSNAAVGAGFEGEVSPDAVDELIDFYASAGIEPRVEVCPYAHVSLARRLSERGFQILWFENVLFRTLAPGEVVQPLHPAPPQLTIRTVNPADAKDVDAYADVCTRGFQPEGAPMPESALEVARRCARHPRIVAVLAELDGNVIGAAAMESHGPIAALFGAVVSKAVRRRGIQQAMIAWRLNHAAAAGAKWATIGTRPGHDTERNTRRVGFEVAYTKVIMVRPAPGLTGVFM